MSAGKRIFERFPELARVPAEKLPQKHHDARRFGLLESVMNEAFEAFFVDSQAPERYIPKAIAEGLERLPALQKIGTAA